jgi:vacuolar-type H+-ATPase subunit F/Vma7
MILCAFIGDEVSAAGFRLAGVEVRVPGQEDPSALFRRLVGKVEILLITAETAARLPQEELRDALAAERPLVLVIPDVLGREDPPDVIGPLKRQLGMAE